MSPSRRASALILGLALAASLPAAAQIYVIPRQAGQNQVRTFEFDWHHVDLAFPVGPDWKRQVPLDRVQPASDTAPSPADVEAALHPPKIQSVLRPVPSGTGQFRLYFYEQERAIAERAASVIRVGYSSLVERFRYVPPDTFPYVLYSSYREFLQTNLSPVGEGTLGFTSTQGDFTLSLPYFGDDRLFEEVSTHELAHQFTLQRVRDVARAAGAMGDPLTSIPLWFIEGLAEFSAHRGINPEGELLVRDLVLHPDFKRRYVLGDFFEQGPANFVWIYKMGQVRCAFLEETYGEGFLMRVLDASWRLTGRGLDGGLGFPELLQFLTGDRPTVISARFERWMKQRAYQDFLASTQDSPRVMPLENAPEYMDAVSASPGGEMLLARTFDPATMHVMLTLMDSRTPQDAREIARDGVPGVESLNLVFGRNFDLGDRRLAFVAESSSRDVIYVHDLTHTRRPTEPTVERPTGGTASLSVGPRRSFELGGEGIVAAFSPSLSPDEASVAFTGLTADGTRDLFLLDLAKGTLRRLTRDPFTERQVHWGPSGILYTSDATERRRFNVFRIQPDGEQAPERLTRSASDQFEPVEVTGGRIFFTAFAKGRQDLYEAVGDAVIRRTDMVTGLSDPSPVTDGRVWALLYRGGRRQPVLLDAEHLAARESFAMTGEEAIPLLERTSLEGASRYEPFRAENLQMGPVFGYGGAAQGGLYGQVYASAADRLRNHAAIFQLAVYGNLDLADGVLYYFNQERQLSWGGGLFQSLRLRTDTSHPGVPFTHYERFLGARAIARHPLNRFTWVEASLGLGSARYFVADSTRELLANPGFRSELGLDPTFRDYHAEWRERVGGDRFQGEALLRAGYDTLRYDPLSGPLAGSSVMLELAGNWQPSRALGFSSLRLDAAHYLHIAHRITLMGQVGAGTSFGGYYAQEFFLSSYDTLRGVHFGDQRFLVGRNYGYGSLELQVPLNQIIATIFLSNIEAVVGMDFGGVGHNARDAWDHRVLNAVAGFNFGLGPLVLRLHFARPFDIGAPVGTPAAGWVTNFTVGMIGMPGFFRQVGQAEGSSGMVPSSAREALPWR